MGLLLFFLIVITVGVLLKAIKYRKEKNSFIVSINNIFKLAKINLSNEINFEPHLISFINKAIADKKMLENNLSEVTSELERAKKHHKNEVERLIKANQYLSQKSDNVIKEKDELYKCLQSKSDKNIAKITSLYSDFLLVQFDISERYLGTKQHPAVTEAKRIKELKAESKSYIEQFRLMLYKYEYLITLFPELANYVEDFETLQQLEDYNQLKH